MELNPHVGLATPAKNLNVVAAIGDSIVFGCNHYVTASALAISGGVLTATTALHGATPGSQLFFNGATPDALNGPIVTMASDRIATTIGSIPTNLPDGVASGSITMALLNSTPENDWLGWASWHAHGKFARGIPLGFQGKGSDYIRGKLPYLLQTDPSAICELSGINDIKTIVTSASTSAEVIAAAEAVFEGRRAIWDQITQAGSIAIPITLTPLNHTYAGWCAQWQRCIDAVNRWTISHCQSRRDHVLVDAHAALVDRASATGNYITGGSGVGLHMTGKSANLTGRTIAEALGQVFGRQGRCHLLPKSAGDYWGNGATSPQLSSNPTGTSGTAGSVTGGASGVCWTGWSLVASAAVASSAVPNSDGNVDVVLTVSGSAGETITLTSQTYTGQVAAGDVLQYVARIKLAGISGLTRIRGQGLVTVAGIQSSAHVGYPGFNLLALDNQDFTMISSPMPIHGAGNVSLSLQFTFAAGGGGTITVGPPAINK